MLFYVLLESLEAAGLKPFQIQSGADDLVKSLHWCLSMSFWIASQ